MYIRNRMASLIYKICIVVACLISLVLNTGLINGTFAPYVLLYYTIASNLFCLIFYAAASIFTAINIANTGKYGVLRFAPHFKGAVVMSMVLTVVFFFLVWGGSAGEYLSGLSLVSNIIAHFVIPLMVMVDWALFDRKGRFFGSDPFIWMVIPFMYYGIVLVAAQMGMQYYGGLSYPYSFIDPSVVRWAPVLVHVFVLTLAYLLVGYLLLGVDRFTGNHAKKKAEEGVRSLLAGDDETEAYQPVWPTEETENFSDTTNPAPAPSFPGVAAPLAAAAAPAFGSESGPATAPAAPAVANNVAPVAAPAAQTAPSYANGSAPVNIPPAPSFADITAPVEIPPAPSFTDTSPFAPQPAVSAAAISTDSISAAVHANYDGPAYQGSPSASRQASPRRLENTHSTANAPLETASLDDKLFSSTASPRQPLRRSELIPNEKAGPDSSRPAL